MRDASEDETMKTRTRNEDPTVVAIAFSLASAAHEGQMRKDGTTPYISHPKRVAEILKRHGADEETVAAGLLHDVLEDTSVTAQTMRVAVGDRVTHIVEEASEPDKSLNWHERKRETISSLRSKSDEAKMVIAADKIHNVRTIAESLERDGDEAWAIFKTGRDDQAWYYTMIAVQLQQFVHPIFEELYETVESVFGTEAMRTAQAKTNRDVPI